MYFFHKLAIVGTVGTEQCYNFELLEKENSPCSWLKTRYFTSALKNAGLSTDQNGLQPFNDIMTWQCFHNYQSIQSHLIVYDRNF